MNCLFVNYSGEPKSLNYFCPDNGLALLSTILNKSGNHRAFILDYCSLHYTDMWELYWEKLKDKFQLSGTERLGKCREIVLDSIINEISDFIKVNRIEVVGFKLWIGEGFRGSCKAAKIIKRKFPNISIIGGGPHVDYYRQYIYKKEESFDCLIQADGETSLLQLLQNINNREKWHSIPNLIFIDSGKIVVTEKSFACDLNSNPTPEYLSDTYLYIKDKLNFFIIEDTRGCPNSCHFCIEPLKSGNWVRCRDVEKITADIKYTMEILNSRGFRFSCSSPNINHRKNLAEKLIEDKLDIKYATFQNVKGVSREYAQLLKDSGCFNVFIGVESFSERILIESFGKIQSFADTSQAVGIFKDSGLYTQCGLIYPAPGEDEDTRKTTYNALQDLKPHSIFALYPVVMPFTRWGKEPGMFNIIIPDIDEYYIGSMEYDIKHTAKLEKWPLFKGISIDDKRYDSLLLDLSNLIKFAQENKIEVQVSIEIPILANVSGQASQSLNYSFHLALESNDMVSIRQIVLNLNDCLKINNRRNINANGDIS